MKDAQKPDHVSLSTLVNRLREGRYVIPDFQREFEWEPSDIQELIRSIFLDYYIGSLLLWKGKQENFDALACENVYGYELSAGDPTHIVLDGQQRLTAMYYAFLAPDVNAPRRYNRYLYFVRVDKFCEESIDQAFEYSWTKSGRQLLDSREAQFESHSFPVAVIGMTGWELANWVQGYRDHWLKRFSEAQEVGDLAGAAQAETHASNAVTFGKHLKSLTEEYQVAFIELDRDLAIDKVCDIFTQINSRGIRLDVFDLINALLKPKGVQLKHLWRRASSRLEFVETAKMNVYILQVMSILRQAYCSPKYLYYLMPGQAKKVRAGDGTFRHDVLVPTVEDFENGWEEAVGALEHAIELLSHPQEFGAISSSYLPYASILPAFAALQNAARSAESGRQLDAQRKIRLWYWASVFLNRYSGAVESTAARDFMDVRAWFDDDALEPGPIHEFRDRFRSIDLRREVRKGTSVYSGIFNLFVLSGARDWMTGKVPKYGDLDDHHIVPKSWGKAHGVGQEIDTILNRAPLTSDTNRIVIGDKLPNSYIPGLIKSNGENAVRGILESHFISPEALKILLRDPFTPADYEAFLQERHRTILEGIEELLIKERLDLSPQLREIDGRVESIELGLRSAIVSALGGDTTGIPPHVQQRIVSRLQAAAKKNPTFNADHYATLAGQLEYADLREVQDVIMSKGNWKHFEVTFVNKETSAKRFDQLAELRNAIRHSRSADEISRKEGEAAVLWFEKLLAS